MPDSGELLGGKMSILRNLIVLLLAMPVMATTVAAQSLTQPESAVAAPLDATNQSGQAVRVDFDARAARRGPSPAFDQAILQSWIEDEIEALGMIVAGENAPASATLRVMASLEVPPNRTGPARVQDTVILLLDSPQGRLRSQIVRAQAGSVSGEAEAHRAAIAEMTAEPKPPLRMALRELFEQWKTGLAEGSRIKPLRIVFAAPSGAMRQPLVRDLEAILTEPPYSTDGVVSGRGEDYYEAEIRSALPGEELARLLHRDFLVMNALDRQLGVRYDAARGLLVIGEKAETEK